MGDHGSFPAPSLPPTELDMTSFNPSAFGPDDSYQIPTQRPQWGEPAAIVVPSIEEQARWGAVIKPGSGIVAFIDPRFAEQMMVYYEGNVFGANNMNTFEDRALNAYGRMSKRYPTTAMMLVDRSGWEVVGEISPDGMQLDETPALQAWVAQDPKLTLREPKRYSRRPF